MKKNIELIDTRTFEEFLGECINVPDLPQHGSCRAGHIPRARNVYFEENIKNDGCFKPLKN